MLRTGCGSYPSLNTILYFPSILREEMKYYHTRKNFRLISSLFSTNIKKSRPIDPIESYWWIISGLSPFSNKDDILSVTKVLNPLDIDCLLDRRLNKTGDWAMKFSFPQTSPTVTYHLTHRCKDVISGFRRIDEHNINRFPLARKSGIDNRTILIRRVPGLISMDHILYLFENYRIDSKSIKLLNRDTNNNSAEYLVKFSDPQEAERAYMERNLTVVEGTNLELRWYDI